MPITIKHGGGDISGLVRLAAIAGAMQQRAPEAPTITPMSVPGGGGGGGGRGIKPSAMGRASELRTARESRMREIDREADLQREAADEAMKRTAVANGLGQEMQEQEYDREVAMLQEKAKVDASKFEQRISVQDRHELAKINNAKSKVRELGASGEWEQGDVDAAMKMLERQEMGIGPSSIPADINKPPPLGEQFVTGPNGETILPARAGTVITAADKTPKALQAKREYETLEKENLAYDKYMQQLIEMEVDMPKTETSGPNPKRHLRRDEITERLDEYNWQVERRKSMVAGGQGAQGEARSYADQENEAARAGAKRQWDEQHGGGWKQQLEATGIDTGVEGEAIPVKVTEDQANMPMEKGAQLAMFDALYKKFPKFSDVPPHLKQRYLQLLEIAEQEYGQR